eukprot:g19144.t1
MGCSCRKRLLAITALVGAATVPTLGLQDEGARLLGKAPTAYPSAEGREINSGSSRRRRQPLASHLIDCHRSLSSPPPPWLHALRARGGAKLAPTQTPAGGGTTSRPILGPITRSSAADSKDGKDKDGGQGEGQQEFAPQFLDFQSRVGFMKKVYLTLSVQLVYTGLVSTLMRAYREPILRTLFGSGNVPPILFMIGTLGTILLTQATMWANVELRQTFPKNLPLLTVFTTAWALYVGVFSLMFTRGSVIRAVFQAAFVVGSLTAYAFRTNPKHELTQLGAGLYSAGNAFGLFCIMKLFFFRGHRASDLALSCLATLFFSLYLVYDTYRIIGGKHRKSGMFGVKDWALAAMALYEDVMQIFIHLLALFGETQG